VGDGLRGFRAPQHPFDAGPDAEVFLRNVNVLGVNLASVDAVVLSHGHWDHAGSLLVALRAVTSCRVEKVWTAWLFG
jgi:metal-dependent hydrolase (beta-lactamase superfamily II)